MSHRPRKRFGQNFLHDPGTIQRLLAAIGPRAGQRLVEIGPGRGAITRGLLAAAGCLDVIELDRDLVAPLAEQLGAIGTLRIHNQDALRFDLRAIVGPGQRLRLVGNLPYNISTPLLFHFIAQADCIEDMHLMLQREVVERIVAVPGNKAYGRLSVMVQAFCQAETLLRIGPGAFTPPPQVESAFLRLIPHCPPPEPIHDPALLARIVAQAFSQRRKTLRNSLKGSPAIARLTACGIDPAQRAEEIPVATYIALANATCIPSSEPRI